MAPVSIALGGFLIVLGLVAYFGTGQVSLTALIPSYCGLGFLVLGILAFKENLRKHVMHGAAALGLLGFLVTGAMGMPKVAKLLAGGDVERPAAAITQTIMAFACGVFVVLCVRSFILARRARAGQSES